MSKKRKYIKGPPILTMNELSDQLCLNKYVFWRNKPQHPAWIQSMTYRTLFQATQKRVLFYAYTEEDIDKIQRAIEPQMMISVTRPNAISASVMLSQLM